MAEKVVRDQAKTDAQAAEFDWASVAPLVVDREDTMGIDKVALVWEKIYRLAGLKNPTEDKRKACRLAVYVYGVLNGTSREGGYSGSIVMSDGTKFSASVIVQATTKFKLRQFYRGNMVESYSALKNSNVIENNDRFVAKAAKLGIAPECAFAMADWFGDCHLLSPAETHAHSKSFAHALERAKRSRGGTLEEVEDERVSAELHAQGEVTGVTSRNVF